MATQYTEYPLVLAQGLDRYLPPILRDAPLLQDLWNVNVFRNRLIPSAGKESAFALEQPITAFGHARDSIYFDSFIYAFLDDKLYFFDPNTEEWTEVVSYFKSLDPFVVIDWAGTLYFTRQETPLTRVQRMETTEVASGFTENGPLLSARYGLVSHGHLFFGNIMEGSNRAPTRVRWSDVDNPEHFIIGTAGEADFFDLDVADTEITGLINLRGQTYIMTGVSVWLASYQGLPTIYRFEPIAEALGVPWHNSVIAHRDVGFFVGSDNIYAIEGRSIEAIGNPVWPVISEELAFDPRLAVYKNEALNQIIWTYDNQDGQRRAILFNYLEGQWSYQDGQKIVAARKMPLRVKSAKTIDLWDEVIDTFEHADEIIDGPWQDVDLPFGGVIEGTSNGHLLRTTDAPVLFEEEETEGFFRTYELDLGTIRDIKKLAALKIYTDVEGSPDLVVRVGIRETQIDPVVWHGPLAVTKGRVSLHFVGRAQFIQIEVKWTNSGVAWLKNFYAIMLEGQATDAGAR